MMMRLLGFAVVAALGTQQDDFGDETRKLLDEGIALYKKGLAAEGLGQKDEAAARYKEAYAKLEQALQRLDKVPADQRRTSADLVYAFLQRVGSEVVTSMIHSADPQIQAMGYRLLKMAEYGEPFREGKRIVLKYVEDLKSDDFAVARNAHWHLKNYGSWACRFLVAALGDANQDKFRSRVIQLLIDMGVDASLAVIECLDSKNEFLRQNAAFVLGHIRDDRALPALKRIYEDPNQKPEVKKPAYEAIARITKKDSKDWRRATDYYYELAQKFYYGDPSTIFVWQPYYLVWKWNTENDRITERRCTRFLYNEELAEEALYDLLDLDPKYRNAKGESAWALLVMNHFQQILEAEANARAAVESLRNDEITREGLVEILRGIEGMSAKSIASLRDEILKASDTNAVHLIVLRYFSFPARILRSNVLANVPGREYLYEALSRSMKDGNALVARACIEAIKEHGRFEDLPTITGKDARNGKGSSTPVGHPLIEALTSDDKRVRYAAAEAMVKLNPPKETVGLDLVIPSLVDALGEQGVRVALVIHEIGSDEDRNFVNRLRQTLISLNVFPVLATSGEDGVIQAKSFPSEDVIILQKRVASQIYFRETITRKQEVENVLQTLTLDVRTRHIPRILLCADEKELADAQAEFKENTPWAIKRNTHKLDLQSLLEKIFESPEQKKDSKDRADLVAKSAAETLAAVDPTNTRLPFRDAVEALVRTVGSVREDFIRVPSAKALGIYGDQRALDVLAKVLANREDAAKHKSLRLQCGKSMSWIYRQTGVAPTKEAYDVLLKTCVEDGDYHIELACGEALGNSKLTEAQRREVVKARRVKRDWYTSDDD